MGKIQSIRCFWSRGLVLLLLGGLLLSGWTAEAVSAATSTPTPAPAPSVPEDPTPVLHYIFDVNYNYDMHYLDVAERIEYHNETGESINELLVVVPPNKRENVFYLKTLTWADGSPVVTSRLKGDYLTITLAELLEPDKTAYVNLTYTLSMPFLASTFGYGYRQTNFGDWYPFVPPYEKGNGWLINDEGKVGEYLTYELADFDVVINLIGKKGVTIAAPAPARVEGSTFRYKHLAARNFAWSASHKYEIVWGRSGDVSVMGYVFPEHVEQGKIAAAAVSEALTFYSAQYGPYPYTVFSFVEADFPDGMEYDGLYFLDRVYYEEAAAGRINGLTTLSVHETAHQWWGQRVSNNPAQEPWLDEALAVYNEYIFFEKNPGLLREDWWSYRVDSFHPTGTVNAKIYNFNSFRLYVNAVYLRGALFLRDLRKAIGDEAFFAFLKEYQQRYRYHQVTGADFFTTLADVSPASIQEPLDEYFQRSASTAQSQELESPADKKN